MQKNNNNKIYTEFCAVSRIQISLFFGLAEPWPLIAVISFVSDCVTGTIARAKSLAFRAQIHSESAVNLSSTWI